MRILNIHFLHECIKFGIRLGEIKYVIVFLYIDYQTNLLKNMKHLQITSSSTWMQLQKHNLVLIVLLSDLNAKLSKWYENDSTSYEGTKIYSFTFKFGMQQPIHEPTYTLPASSSCIDLIFVSQPNLVAEQESIRLCINS